MISHLKKSILFARSHWTAPKIIASGSSSNSCCSVMSSRDFDLIRSAQTSQNVTKRQARQEKSSFGIAIQWLYWHKTVFWIAIQWIYIYIYWHMLLVFLAFVVSFFPWKVAFWCLLAQQTHLLEHIHFSLKYLNSPSKLEHQVSTKTSRHVKSQVTLHPSSGLPKKLMLHGVTIRVAYLASWNCLTSW